MSKQKEIWKLRIAQLAESGLSQRGFALQHVFGVSQVGCWAHRLASAPEAALMQAPVVMQLAAPAMVLRLAKAGWSTSRSGSQCAG